MLAPRAYSIIIIIYQVQVLCCETAHGVYVTERETTVITTHRAAAAAALWVHIKLTFRLLRRHTSIIVDDRTYFYAGTKKREMSTQKNKNIIYWIRTSDAEIKGTTTYQMFAYSGSRI